MRTIQGSRIWIAITLMAMMWIGAGERAFAECINYEDYLHWDGMVETPVSATDVAVSGDYAYVGDFRYVHVVDISDPGNRQIVGSVEMGYTAFVEVSEDYLYVSDYSGNHQVLDVSDPQNPQIVGTFTTAGSSKFVPIADTRGRPGSIGTSRTKVSVTST